MKEHDVVYLEDGRRATIIHLYPDGKTAEVEISLTNETETVKIHTLTKSN